MVGSVYTVFALDVLQSAVVAAQAWAALCSGWVQTTDLQFPGWSITAFLLISSVSKLHVSSVRSFMTKHLGLVAFWVQLFYAWRIHKLSKRRVIPVVIVAASRACVPL